MRILGIDLGSSSVKAVELDTSFGRFEIHEYHEQRVPADGNATEVAGALVAGLPRKPDRIVVSLRTNRTTFRNLNLPTKDKRAIQSSVGFELEDELPFPIEQAVYDYSIVSQAGQSSQVHVAATLSRHVEVLLAELQEQQIDPDLVSTEAWAYHILFNRVLPEEEKEVPVLLLQLGVERSTLYVHHKGVPLIAREIPVGGRDLTMAVAETYGIPLDQAEEAKLSNGFILPPSQRSNHTPDQQRFSDTLAAPLMELIREARQAALTCKSMAHHSIGMIYVSGGTSQLPGLDRLIEEELGLPVKHLQALSALSSSQVAYSEPADKSMVLAASLALCLVGTGKTGTINLRQGELAKRGASRAFKFELIRRPALAVAMILICLFTSVMIQGMVYERKLRDTDREFKTALKRAFGTSKTDRELDAYIKDASKLLRELESIRKRKAQAQQLFASNPRNPLNLLRGVSQSIQRDPKGQTGLDLDLLRFEVGAAAQDPAAAAATPFAELPLPKASLTFAVKDQPTIERVRPLIEAKLQALEQSKPEQIPGRDNRGTRLKITFSGQTKEESFGGK